ncbi:MAG: membrane protein insertion efficiency factor YidD [Ignavibacterium sp.]|jgi:putative component of membrane protein insertase Oxa1/YidC/SpoIIIJ protein YidD|nr:membrane protein insertion efficiency factor YidD [Ignavibacterium sp.]
MLTRPAREILKSFKIFQSNCSLGRELNHFIFVITVIVFFASFLAYPQTDWVRWEKSDPTYQIQEHYLEREYNFSVESTSDIIVKPVINAYWFFISDVDGANCPFNPSCSSFLAQSISETNILQGTIMFFDRFTRDTNIFDRQEHYPKIGKNHLYDPVSLYTLNKGKVNYIPVNSFIKE